jgi:acetylornithine deacetylase
MIEVNHPIVSLVQKNTSEVTNIVPVPRGGGGSDLRCLVKYANTPSIVFGGGTGANFHGIDEYLEVESLIQSTKIIALTILDWCG